MYKRQLPADQEGLVECREDLGGDVLIDAFEDVEEAIDGLLADFYVRRALAR